MGRTVSLTLRDTELHSYHWSRSFRERTDITEEIYRMAIKLLDTNWPNTKKVRLIGVGVSNIERKQYEQLDIFSFKEKYRRSNHAVDEIRQRYGNLSIKRGSSITEAGILHAFNFNRPVLVQYYADGQIKEYVVLSFKIDQGIMICESGKRLNCSDIIELEVC